MTQIRIFQLDAVRGLAALVVVVFHYVHFAQPGNRPLEPLLWPIYTFGATAVPLFFMLSGVIFFAVYADRIASRSIGWREFLVLRLSRLYPLHLASLLVVAALQFAIHEQFGTYFVYKLNDLPHFFCNLALIQFGWFPTGFSFNGPSWSIAIEAGLYAIFFVFITLCGRATLPLVITAAIATVMMAAPTISWYAPFHRFFLEGMSCFFIGGCINAFVSSNAPQRHIYYAITALVLTGGVVMALLSAGWGLKLLIFPALLLSALRSQWFATILDRALLRWLGEISYSLYMWHFTVQLIFYLASRTLLHIDFGSPITLAAYLLASLSLANASYYWLELPAKNYIRSRVQTSRRRYSRSGVRKSVNAP
jgi:peptidoglycan/LPS O-acetylase OafA/YrhL